MKKAVLLMCLTIFVFSTLFAANFPTKPITYVVCFDPGGESDITARIQQPYLEKILGVPIVITYKAGGGGATGWSELVNRATPDGYSIWNQSSAHHTPANPRWCALQNRTDREHIFLPDNTLYIGGTN